MKKIFMMLAVVGAFTFTMASCGAETTAEGDGADTEETHDHEEGGDHEGHEH